MRKYDWDGNLVWEHLDPCQHHDARRLAGGSTAYLAYAKMDPAKQALVQGHVPGSETESGLFEEFIREVDQNGALVERPSNTFQPLADGNYLISSKVMNLIFIADRNTRALAWHYQNDEMGGQHDAQMLDKGNILLFANWA